MLECPNKTGFFRRLFQIRRLTLETASSVALGLEWDFTTKAVFPILYSRTIDSTVDFSFYIISPFHIQNHSLSYKRGRTTDGCWHSSTGVSPRPMLVGAARNALWSVLIARSHRPISHAVLLFIILPYHHGRTQIRNI